MKIIAYYLPQFHNIPENDEWWGDGFTEWVSVRGSYPVFDGHKQPRVPLEGNYYNLLDDEVKKWQVDLAKEYGIYGFCYYHYWFNGKMLLERPLEQVLANKEIDLPFCITWANEPWTKRWVGNNKKVLIQQEYGDKQEWEEHFNYLLPFFRDERYIKVDGKPFFFVYKPEVVPCLKEMLEYWNERAIEEGFRGIFCPYKLANPENAEMVNENLFDCVLEHQPQLARTIHSDGRSILGALKRARRELSTRVEKYTGFDLTKVGSKVIRKASGVNRQDYQSIWDTILSLPPTSERSIPGAFIDWDNSPRYHEDAEIFIGASPDKFQHNLTKQIARAKKDYQSDLMFMFAWNEWAEGAYLEPDELNGYGYLEAVRQALKGNGEWPVDYTTSLTSVFGE